MKTQKCKIASVSILAAAFFMAIGLSVSTSGQANKQQGIGLVDDWSHHHVVFSNPGTAAQALAEGHFNEWYRTISDPRFQLQQMKRARMASASASLASPIEKLALLPDISDLTDPSDTRRARKKDKVSKDWNMSLGSGGTLGAGQYPALFAANYSVQSCNDFAVYNTGLAGGASQPTIIAYNNLYSGCGTVPSVYWQYNTAYPQGSTTGDGSKITTSVTFTGPVGAAVPQIAFVQVNSSNVASLVLMKYASNSTLVLMNTASNNVVPGSYSACAAPCMTRITLSGSPNDTNSAPFDDYFHDVIYVGDNSGKLHKFNPVFFGTPAEVTAGGWPATASSQTSPILTSPVYDPNSTYVFVGDATGYLHRVTTTGTIAATASGDIAAGTGIVDAPIIDSTPSTPVVYAFVGDDNSGSSGVFQFATGFASSNSGIEETLGTSGTSSVVYAGAFDNTHYNGLGTTGNLYVCGTHHSGAFARLYQIVMNSGFTGTVNTISTISGTTAAHTCSPVTEFLASNTDWIFVGVSAYGSDTGCTGTATTGCLYNYNVGTATTSATPSAATAGIAAAGGASGSIIDAHGFIYYSNLANGTAACTGNGTTGNSIGGCAVQASQSAP